MGNTFGYSYDVREYRRKTIDNLINLCNKYGVDYNKDILEDKMIEELVEKIEKKFSSRLIIRLNENNRHSLICTQGNTACYYKEELIYLKSKD